MARDTLALAGAACLVVALLVGGFALATSASGPRRLVAGYLTWLDAALARTLATTSARQVLALQVLATVACLLGAAAIAGWLIVLAPLPFALTGVALAAGRRARFRALEDQLSPWLVAMANTLKTSGSIADALGQTLGALRAPLAQELDVTVKGLRLGAPVDAALRDLGERVASASLSAAITTLVVGRRTGGALPTLLEGAALSVRERLRLERVFRQHTAAARLQIIVLALGPLVLIGALLRTQPTFFDPLFASAVGVPLIAIAGVLWLAAVGIARRIMASVV